MPDGNLEMRQLRIWVQEHAIGLLRNPDNGVIGVGVGRKHAGPLDDDSAPLSVTAFVERKLSQRELRREARPDFAESFAATAGASAADLEMEIDVVDAGGAIQPLAGLKAPSTQRGAFGGKPPAIDLQDRFERLRIGLGITNPHRAYPNYLGVGTAGFFVRDEEDRLYVVSNNHVIADENNAQVGDSIVQPGTLDLTRAELSTMGAINQLQQHMQIGELSAWVDIQFPTKRNTPNNYVDVAIAEIDENRRDVSEVARIGLGGNMRGIRSLVVDEVTGALNMSPRVHKAGRTTGWTEGEIVNVAVAIPVGYGGGSAFFVDQIGIQPTADNNGPFSAAGDSGSGIFNVDHELVGLLFAGSPGRTIANPIDEVMTQITAALGRGPLRPA